MIPSGSGNSSTFLPTGSTQWEMGPDLPVRCHPGEILLARYQDRDAYICAMHIYMHHNPDILHRFTIVHFATCQVMPIPGVHHKLSEGCLSQSCTAVHCKLPGQCLSHKSRAAMHQTIGLLLSRDFGTRQPVLSHVPCRRWVCPLSLVL